MRYQENLWWRSLWDSSFDEKFIDFIWNSLKSFFRSKIFRRKSINFSSKLKIFTKDSLEIPFFVKSSKNFVFGFSLPLGLKFDGKGKGLSNISCKLAICARIFFLFKKGIILILKKISQLSYVSYWNRRKLFFILWPSCYLHFTSMSFK